MTPGQLEAVVARTGVRRYRWLTGGDNPDVASREAYRRLVERLAAGGPAAPPVPLAASLRAAKHGGRNCPHGSPPSCGCSGLAACSLLGRDVTIRDCTECLTTGPRSREV